MAHECDLIVILQIHAGQTGSDRANAGIAAKVFV